MVTHRHTTSPEAFRSVRSASGPFATLLEWDGHPDDPSPPRLRPGDRIRLREPGGDGRVEVILADVRRLAGTPRWAAVLVPSAGAAAIGAGPSGEGKSS